MDFMVPDLLSTAAHPAMDEGVRVTRSTASSSTSGTRKSFSAVLERVRGEEGRANTHETDSTRASNKVSDRSDLKEAKGLHSSTSRSERSDGEEASVSGGRKIREGQDETGEGSSENLESSVRQSDAGSEPEGQGLMSIVPATILQAGVQATAGETLVTYDDPHASDSEKGSAPETSPAPVVSGVPPQPTESRSSEKSTTVLPIQVPEQTARVSGTQQGTESPAKQSATPEGKKDTRVVTTDHLYAQTVNPTSPTGETAIAPNPKAPQIVSAHEGMLLPAGPSDRNLVTPDQGGDKSGGHATDKQAPLVALALGSREESATTTQVLTPHGQQPVMDQGEQFGQLGQDRNDRQQGNHETPIFQGTAVDLQSMNGRTTEQYAAVAQGQTASVPTARTPSLFVPPAQPAHPMTDVAQQPIASLLRSVVVDVAQPDLGHVNIRVAMMNDSVHAHFSTDRAEVGQYLMNGQDRLQTTLQANGLDMGQFRVDIDRQHGGRSFHQGLSQEQGQSWNQGSPRLGEKQVQGRPDDVRRSLQGRLNVVA